MMMVIKVPNSDAEQEAIGFLVVSGFSGRLFRSGELIVPEQALEPLAREGFSFTVLGQATEELMTLPPDLLYERKVLPWPSP